MDFQPHIATWSVPGTEPQTDPETGFPIPTEDITMSVPCRYHSENGKQFTNEVNQPVFQKGRIRFVKGSQMPSLYENIKVTDGDVVVFEGPVMEVYRGQLGCRCDV